MSTRVGFIGLGNMGSRMAANVLRAGFELVVFNRTASRAGVLAAGGARVAESPARLTEEVDVVLACLGDIPASREVFTGPGGVIPSCRPGQILVDHSTVDLDTSRACHRAAEERGAAFLDAPVSGGPGGAADGTLSIMAGGVAEAFERARPVLDAMGANVLLMGPAGAGTATKLINQLLVGVHTVAACEGLLLGERAGVDAELLAGILSKSWGASRMLERAAPIVRARGFRDSGAPLRNIHKDLGIIVRLGEELGVPMPTAREAKRLYDALMAAGRGEEDGTVAFEWLAEQGR